MDIFVGSLSFKLKESELREAFEKYGEVNSAKIIIDKITRQSKGFGFVEMPDEEQARFAISQLNGAEMHGRPLVVNEAQKREASAPRPARPNPRPTSSGDRYTPSSTERNTDFGASSEEKRGERVFRDADKPAGGSRYKDYGKGRGEGKKNMGSKRGDSRRGRNTDFNDDWY
ncbi:RNA recognition motif-containing protein [Dyadobacter jejuensis]|uniref:RNA recognition motif-containing protein n=1 Tax=Dyadobacter jejuensis TaxID=1082580 RepID=A0A316ASV8_9BACT|nr:RNA-binding protein [Dyadobacter jejuensis]PWJ60551.1 RNA recognition motif-containing protein [Dyadobacter jejuensis]